MCACPVGCSDLKIEPVDISELDYDCRKVWWIASFSEPGKQVFSFGASCYHCLLINVS